MILINRPLCILDLKTTTNVCVNIELKSFDIKIFVVFVVVVINRHF